MSHFLIFGWCEDCRSTRDLTVHGKCGTCGSAAVTVRNQHVLPKQSVISELMELEEMFRRTD